MYLIIGKFLITKAIFLKKISIINLIHVVYKFETIEFLKELEQCP